MVKKNTSWGSVADWYDTHLSSDSDSYHVQVVLPNLLRLVSAKKGDRILDLACGTGFFSREFFAITGSLVGIDVSSELISIAKKSSPQGIEFAVSSAERLGMIKDGSMDNVILVLAIQNIEKVKEMFGECARVLRPGGTMHIVMNHPSFRIPKKSSWGFDEKAMRQYRRVDAYMSESEHHIDMQPSSSVSVQTLSFHRPLQYYVKLLASSGFVIARIEEWISHKKSEPGLRQKEEDRIRKEIPMFMYMGLEKR